ncbi:uncharacterized protein LOC135374423, partial [Ornithodoros turicata]|uniref:uncharacterized protein LOC135374423 n=1 Tax=Ornithodoros turicata TaxID=34597 RepID=UPI003138F326
MEPLQKVLQAFKTANLTLKLAKYEFFMPEVTFLGFKITRDRIRPGPDKLEAVSQFPRPRNVHAARPLTELTKKEKEFVWSDEQERAFESLNGDTDCDREDRLDVLFTMDEVDRISAVQRTDAELGHVTEVLKKKPEERSNQLRALDADDGSERTLNEIRQLARESIEGQQMKQEHYYNLRRRAAPKYDAGDIVLVKRLPVHTGKPTKTQQKYRGPMVIDAVLPNDT